MYNIMMILILFELSNLDENLVENDLPLLNRILWSIRNSHSIKLGQPAYVLEVEWNGIALSNEYRDNMLFCNVTWFINRTYRVWSLKLMFQLHWYLITLLLSNNTVETWIKASEPPWCGMGSNGHHVSKG